MEKNLGTLKFILKNYKNFNARATRDALLAYWKHLSKGGKMFLAMAGAMSTVELGITLAPAIRKGIIHGMSVTGANLEESLFRLTAHKSYKSIRHYIISGRSRRMDASSYWMNRLHNKQAKS